MAGATGTSTVTAITATDAAAAPAGMLLHPETETTIPAEAHRPHVRPHPLLVGVAPLRAPPTLHGASAAVSNPVRRHLGTVALVLSSLLLVLPVGFQDPRHLTLATPVSWEGAPDRLHPTCARIVAARLPGRARVLAHRYEK